MEVFHFSEQAYPHAWEHDTDSLRVTFPNENCDPDIASQMINERLDEWIRCDDLGLNILVNEHHSTATSMSPSCTITLAMLAKSTKNARLMGLGFPIANRPDPIRLAEEIAYIDVVSKGRLNIGFVKGAPYEIAPANMNPVNFMDRFREAHDLILKALTTHDGPFSWEGEYYQYRNVNIWPRPYQSPRPPVWIPAGSLGSAKDVGRMGHNMAMFLSGPNAGKLIEAHKEGAKEGGHPEPGPQNYAYMGLMGVGKTRELGHERANKILGYLRTTSKVADAFMNPPGYMNVFGNMSWLKKNQTRGRAGNHFPVQKRDGTIIKIGSGRDWSGDTPMEDLIDAGIVFAGTPDDVYDQMAEFSEYSGGIGNYVIMAQGGELDHAETLSNLTLFGEEVMPRLKVLT